MNKEKIAVIQIARMGDLLQSLPLLNALHKNFHISVFIDKNLVELANLFQSVDEIIPIDIQSLAEISTSNEISLLEKYEILKKYVQSFSSMNFSKVINLNYSSLSCLIADAISTQKKLGFYYQNDRRTIYGTPWMDYLLTSTSTRRFNRINLSDIFLYSAGSIISSEMPSRYFFNNAKEKKAQRKNDETTISIQTATGHRKRFWPDNYFSALCRMLLNDKKVKIYLTGTAKERERAEKIKQSAAENERIVNIAGKTTVKELSEILSQSDLVITCDTGTMHLAASLDTTVLALFFGPAFCFETGPFTKDNYIIQSFKKCAPCMESIECINRECLNSVSPELVYKTSLSILSNNESILQETTIPNDITIYKTEEDSFGITCEPLFGNVHNYENKLTDELRLTWFYIMNNIDSKNPFLDKISKINFIFSDNSYNKGITDLYYLVKIRKKLLLSLPHQWKSHFEIDNIDERINSLKNIHPLAHIIRFFFRNIERHKFSDAYSDAIFFHNNFSNALYKLTINCQIQVEENYGFI
ncbi:MAG: glycosyltransferase family 9 protein [Candidatus Schekmanbacteria bacterium]|nr:MAG: glycosyltransferase family 9 protein [Candidatus Schekmanbacteria bacterium]